MNQQGAHSPDHSDTVLSNLSDDITEYTKTRLFKPVTGIPEETYITIPQKSPENFVFRAIYL